MSSSRFSTALRPQGPLAGRGGPFREIKQDRIEAENRNRLTLSRRAKPKPASRYSGDRSEAAPVVIATHIGYRAIVAIEAGWIGVRFYPRGAKAGQLLGHYSYSLLASEAETPKFALA